MERFITQIKPLTLDVGNNRAGKSHECIIIIIITQDITILTLQCSWTVYTCKTISILKMLSEEQDQDVGQQLE